MALPAGNMIEQKRKAGPRPFRAKRLEIGKVLRIERDNLRKPVEILNHHLPRAIAGNIRPIAFGHGLGARVRYVTDMPIARAGGIDAHIQPGHFNLPSERGFGQRRPTDIAKANKQH